MIKKMERKLRISEILSLLLIFLFSSSVYAADHWVDYMDDNGSSSYGYPLWMEGLGLILFKLLIAGFIWTSIMGKECRLSSLRGVTAIIVGVSVFIFSLTI